jgi:hypothetical protein
LPYRSESTQKLVAHAFGDDAADLVSRVEAALDEAYAEPMVF